MIKKILVTGGAGYIGAYVSELLIKQKKQVFIADDLSTGYKKLINKKSKFFHCDILMKIKLRRL